MRCPKCQGCIIVSYDDRYCINCAMRFHTPDASPIVTEAARRWLSVLCARCHVRGAIRGHTLCRPCWNLPKELEPDPEIRFGINRPLDNGQEQV